MLKYFYIITMIALAIYREARGEPDEGQIAVAYSIVNRAKDPLKRWPSNPIEVITQPWQYSSFTAPGDSQLVKFPKLIEAKEYLRKAYRVYHGLVPDPTKGANHYHGDYMSPFPKWADARKKTTHIGQHIFYKF